MRKLFKTADGVYKGQGDAYYCVQDGTRSSHHYPFEVQLIKIENQFLCTSKRLNDSRLALSDPGVKRFHSKKVAKAWSKYITKLNSKTKKRN